MDSENTHILCEEIRARRVLVVDDEALIRWAAAATLADAGFHVLEASTVAHARRLITMGPLDAALLDVRLSDGHGTGLVAEIRHTHPRCGVIIMTAFRTPELAVFADAAHSLVLDKPFSMPDMVACVEQLLTP